MYHGGEAYPGGYGREAYPGVYSLVYHGGYASLVYIYPTIPPWVYPLYLVLPVYYLPYTLWPADEALGSVWEKAMGMRRIETSLPLGCEEWWATLCIILPVIHERMDKDWIATG